MFSVMGKVQPDPFVTVGDPGFGTCVSQGCDLYFHIYKFKDMAV